MRNAWWSRWICFLSIWGLGETCAGGAVAQGLGDAVFWRTQIACDQDLDFQRCPLVAEGTVFFWLWLGTKVYRFSHWMEGDVSG